MTPIYFVLPEIARQPSLAQLDVDREWRQFASTTRAWILQTYLRLAQRGEHVALRSDLPTDGVAIFSMGDYRELLRQRSLKTDALLVAVRGSFERIVPFADVEIVQNMSLADGRRRFFMPHWPQPGLIRRDGSRGAKIAKIAFKGFVSNLHPDFTIDAWIQFLSAHGIEWVVDAVPYESLDADAHRLRWNDFSDVDLVLAVRPPGAGLATNRPATKLYNAWLAGVPALMGVESACRALRTDDLDYIEITNLAQAKHAVLQLISTPQRYLDMIERAEHRARDYSVDAIAQRWMSLLREVLTPLADRLARRRLRARSMHVRQLCGRVVWKARSLIQS